MTEQQAVKESIEHWERMIEWAKTQDALGKADDTVMLNVINEYWEGAYCALCLEYCKCVDNGNYCGRCPLGKISLCSVKGSLWGKVTDSVSWKEWLINAQEMLKTLESLAIRR